MSIIGYFKDVKVRYEADIVVVGSGMAGISAAISAALQGCSVLLIERFGMLGGNSTTGGVASFCGNTIGQGKVFDMVVEGLEAFGAITPLNPNKDSRVFNHEILAVVLQELVLKHNVKVLLHTRFVDVICKDGLITECLVCGKSGLEAIRAKQFIDCTGEGELAARAGFSTMKGGESGYQLPMSLMYFVKYIEENEKRCEIPEGWFEKIDTSDKLPMTSIWPNGPGSNAVKIKIPMFDSTDTESMTAAEIQGRRKMMSVMDYHQRVEKKNWLFDHCSPMIGIREGCRIVGDYILTLEDLRAGRSFDDS
ncbi:MAG TPA: FAD-dependent oxidoreductase, partial [Clostridiales bacterium]|nr:FAD-dependent oxidoreductase [Clostridiales bacterium]